eukprot:SM000441S16123  [mRNA]  locus=s441:16177:19803:- [translate_table: standard]
MTSTAGLVPITRQFLAKFYDQHPFDPLPPDVARLHARLQPLLDSLDALRSKTPGDDQLVVSKLDVKAPHKIDENLWKNREQIEEIQYLCDKEHWPASLAREDAPDMRRITDVLEKLKPTLQDALKIVADYQSYTGEKVFSMVITYMPQDFRGTLIKTQRTRSELRRQAEVDALVASGGTIAQKYALLWNQQMDRRRTLASLGSATGVYRTLVKYLVGVPQVLLDFVRQINDHNGPMEEQRDRYGPPLYELTEFVTRLRIFLALWWAVFDEVSQNAVEYTQILEEGVTLYCAEFTRFTTTLRTIFENSPFLIPADDAAAVDDFKETTILNGLKHEVLLTVECEGCMVAWDFKLTYGKDVGFSVEFEDAQGNKMGMLPYQRLEFHQGNFYAPGVGSYRLVWDNSYSYINKKTVRYKVDAIPPVAPAASQLDEADAATATSGFVSAPDLAEPVGVA